MIHPEHYRMIWDSAFRSGIAYACANLPHGIRMNPELLYTQFKEKCEKPLEQQVRKRRAKPKGR